MPGVDDIVPLETAGLRYLQWALAHHGGDRRSLAAQLGISERTLYRKLAVHESAQPVTCPSVQPSRTVARRRSRMRWRIPAEQSVLGAQIDPGANGAYVLFGQFGPAMRHADGRIELTGQHPVQGAA